MHGNGTSERIRSGILNAKKIECSLKLSILSLSAMKAEESNICKAAQLNDVRTEKAVRLIRAGCFNCGKIRFFCADIFDDIKAMIRKCKDIFEIFRCMLQSHKYVEKERIMSFFK